MSDVAHFALILLAVAVAIPAAVLSNRISEQIHRQRRSTPTVSSPMNATSEIWKAVGAHRGQPGGNLSARS